MRNQPCAPPWRENLQAQGHSLFIPHPAIIPRPERAACRFRRAESCRSPAGGGRPARLCHHYTLRVQASNNRGVWNGRGVTLRLEILPPWWGATVVPHYVRGDLFWRCCGRATSCVSGNCMHQFDMTLEARIGERTRIARELHDTLLQSFQGALLRFQSVANVVTTRPDEARERLERALDQAEAAIPKGAMRCRGCDPRLRAE